MTYAALWNHSHYSILDSTMSVDDLIDAAVEMEMPAIGLTDRNSVAGAVQFYKKAKAAGLHPVIGAEVKPTKHPIALLAENSRGYTNLSKLLTKGASLDTLAAHSEGLICLTASEENLAQYREIYGRNLAFAIAPHNEPDLRLSRTLAAQGRKLRIPIAATANAHYRRPKDRLRYDILSAIRIERHKASRRWETLHPPIVPGCDRLKPVGARSRRYCFARSAHTRMALTLTQQKGLIFRIVHRGNVPWIFDNGMHARNGEKFDSTYRSIGNVDLIDKRSKRQVEAPPGGTLCDYIPFYFTPYSIMMYNIRTGYGATPIPNEEIVVFVSSLPHIASVGIPFVFTNQHAYPPMASYFTDLAQLDQIMISRSLNQIKLEQDD